jgi:hypothetical protein
VLAFARQVFALRRSRPELSQGSLALPGVGDEDVLVIERAFDGNRLTCLFNLGTKARELHHDPQSVVLLSLGVEAADNRLRLAASGFAITAPEPR